jgi:hypothetical protein
MPRYVIEITSKTQQFIAVINEGVIPQIEEGRNFFIIGNEDNPNEIVTQSELIRKLGTNYESDILDLWIWPN